MARPPTDPATRFWAKVEKQEVDKCWPWLGAKTAAGYGLFNVGGGRLEYAHRFVIELTTGQPLPEGLTVDHTCHNRDLTCPGGVCPHRACCNPFHVQPETRGQNVLNGRAPSAEHARKTHCPQGHAYDVVNTYVGADGSRQCRACHKAWMATEAAKARRREHRTLRQFTPRPGHIRKSHCPKGHPYDEENTYIRPGDGSIKCRTCARESQRRQADTA